MWLSRFDSPAKIQKLISGRVDYYLELGSSQLEKPLKPVIDHP